MARVAILCCGAQASLVVEHGVFSSYNTCNQQVGCTGLVALQHVGLLWSRDRTHVPCIGRWILNHWTTKKVPHLLFKGGKKVIQTLMLVECSSLVLFPRYFKFIYSQ